MAKRLINPNLKCLVKSFVEQEYDTTQDPPKLVAGKRGAVLVGSSRSGKTIASIDFIILYATRFAKKGVVNIIKETYNEFKTTLYNDFSQRLDDFGLHNPFPNAQEIKSFKIFGVKINFLGADKINKFHGAQCDLLWLNEPLPIAEAIFNQSEMRCKQFWWIDFNPSVTQHWIFDKLMKRHDVGYLRTTFRDNPFISVQEKMKILGYEPWETGSYEILDGQVFYQGQLVDESHQPPPHLDNIEQGTADEYMWRVYGLGLRGSMKGQIFKLVTYIDKFPDIAFTYGLDFGFTNDPSALVKYAREGKNIYLELLLYTPTESAELLHNALVALGISQYVPITADSADKFVSEKKGVTKMVTELFDRGWEISKVSKTKSIMYWITDMKGYKIHIVRNHLVKHAIIEQENYKFKEVNGILINQPIDGFDHFWSSGRYAHMSHEINNFDADYG